MENQQIVMYEIHTLDNMISRWVASLCEKDGLTQMQGWIIGYLYDHSSENVFQKDIEARFHIAPSTASGILKLMEKRDFILRRPVPDDARLKRLALTQKGISHQLNIIYNFERMDQMLKEGIPEEQLGIFFDVIHYMKKNVQNAIP